jgi:predicted transcriptional regulator YheO
LASVEVELGGPLASLTREQQQLAIRRLDELGAFTLRRAVEDISKAIGISRITVYNYLNALYR